MFLGVGLFRDNVAFVERYVVQDALGHLGGLEQAVQIGGQAEPGVDLGIGRKSRAQQRVLNHLKRLRCMGGRAHVCVGRSRGNDMRNDPGRKWGMVRITIMSVFSVRCVCARVCVCV